MKTKILIGSLISLLLVSYTSLTAQEKVVNYSPKPWLPTIWKSDPLAGNERYELISA
ncbi:MAG: hypothetical protein NTV01_02410 [Bacteroidia bacterium]|nr:hypothetical protein [Bacteroidia bacterium]